MTTVTQADREAAAAYWKLSRIGNNETQRRYLSGEADNSFIVQAFAAHREEAFEAGAKAMQDVLDALRKAGPIHAGPVGGELGRKYPDARQCVIEFAPEQGSGAYDLHSALVSLRAALSPRADRRRPAMTEQTEREVLEVAFRGFVVVQPLLEPRPSTMVKIGPLAAFAYVRWSSYGIGIELLAGGCAFFLGPLMIGAVRIKTFQEYAERKAAIAREGE